MAFVSPPLRSLVAAALLARLVTGQARGVAATPTAADLAAGSAAISAAMPLDGRVAFALFRRASAEAARKRGDAGVAGAIESLGPGTAVPRHLRPVASRLLRAYFLARASDRLAPDLSELLRFRTLRGEGKTRWDEPEFVRQRAWLEARAKAIGLAFRSVDGRVEEISLPGPERVVAVVAHGDVVGVAGQAWSVPPWEGRIVGERVVGRGAMDDKGPIVPVLHALAALRDSGFALGATVRLLVPEGEETDWSDVAYYLERARPPDATVGMDGTFTVTHAQKIGALIKLTAGAGAESARGRYRVVSIASGIAPNVIPDRAEAVLEATPYDGALDDLARRARAFVATHPEARIEASEDERSRDGGTAAAGAKHLRVTAHGKAGHAAIPQNAHNALADLVAFVGSLDLVPDRWGALAMFLATAVGTATDGRGLGIAHHDDVMGDLTTNVGVAREEDGVPTVFVDARVPRGLSKEEIERRVGTAVTAFGAASGARIAATVRMSPVGPYLVPPDAPIVTTLMRTWTDVTGRPAKLVVTGGGTQARLFRNGVDFGPALTVEGDRSHQADEYMTIDELKLVGELAVAALLELAEGQPEPP